MKKSRILALAMSASFIFGGGLLLVEPSNIAYAEEVQCNQEQIDALKNQIKTLEEKIEGINTQIEEKENEKVPKEEVNQLLDAFVDANEAYKAYLNSKKNVTDELDAAQNKEVEEYEKAKALSDECKTLYDEWQNDKEDKEKENAYNAKYAEYQAQNARYLDAKAKNLQKQAEHKDFLEEANRIFAGVREKKKALDAAKKKNEDLDQEIKKLINEKKDYDEKIADLRQQVAELESKCPSNPDPNPNPKPDTDPKPDPEPDKDSDSDRDNYDYFFVGDDEDLEKTEEEPENKKEPEKEKESEKEADKKEEVETKEEKEPEKKEEKAPEIKKENGKPAMNKPAKAKSNNPKTGIAGISSVAGTLAISMAGIVASRKKNK